MIRAPKGTKDVLPANSGAWHYIEDKMRKITAHYGFAEVRTPAFEHTELFLRGVGDTTDVVQKEMYTFNDKGDRSITLKPEGTAGVVRMFIENGMNSLAMPLKMYYINSPVFRYENPQSGRLREHHQFGVEFFGAQQPSADAEVMLLAYNLLQSLGVHNAKASINSIGCPDCRPHYNEILKQFLAEKLPQLCDTCKERFARNPLRILDCKVESCQHAIIGAPKAIDYLCPECDDHFATLQRYLTDLDVPFEIDTMIVRGLDYYTKTVFEFIADLDGRSMAICAGGRYDKLIATCEGPDVPGVGFGMGEERLLMLLQQQNLLPLQKPTVQIYLASFPDTLQNSFVLAQKLRAQGVGAEINHTGRSLKAQLKYADKMDYPYMCVVGPDEVATGMFKVKHMQTGAEETVCLDDMAGYILKGKV